MAKLPGTASLTQNILAQSTREDLHLFFMRYLRTDVKAQLEFLARFSDKIDMDEEVKYEWLFYKSFQMLRGSSAFLGVSKQKILLRIYSELYGQASDALAIHHYVKTFFILRYGLSFIRLLAHKERTLNKGFQEVYEKYLTLLYQLFESDLPRDLIIRIIPFVEQEISLSSPELIDGFNSYTRLKIRMEYYHNGTESLLDYIEKYWGPNAMKTSGELRDFYFILFTEPWMETTIQTFAHLKVPREVWRKVLTKINQEGLQSQTSYLWKVFQIEKIFSDKKYKTFIKSMKPKRKSIKSSV